MDVAKAKTDLEAEKDLVISSQRRVDQNAAEETRLTNRIKTALSDGDPQGTAKEYALSLAHVREQLASNTRAIGAAQGQLRGLCQESGSRGRGRSWRRSETPRTWASSCRNRSAEAKFSGLAENLNLGMQPAPLGDAMSKMQDRIFAAKAKTAVANDLNQESLAKAKDDELEQQAKADAILAEFAKK